MTTGIQAHLTRYIQDMMKQKFRLDESKKEYEKLLHKIKERIIDQTNMIDGMKDYMDEEEIKPFEDRKKADQEHQARIEEIIHQKSDILVDIMDDIYHHLLELTNRELDTSGFVTHIITTDEHTKFDENRKIIHFDQPGRVEIPLATVLRRWADASQMTLIPKENGNIEHKPLVFSYYFDVERKHVINCGFDVTDLYIQKNQDIQATFEAYIEEIRDGKRLKRESIRRTFIFHPIDDEKHNIDFLRFHYADENKWVFEIRNNTDLTQGITLGLISHTINKNPIGVEILHNSDMYKAELKGSNLSEIDPQTISPTIRQTMIQEDFSQAGYPAGFSSQTAVYHADLKLMRVNDFEISYPEYIPAETPFTIAMRIAPEELNLKYEGYPFLELEIENIGDIQVHKDKITFLRKGRPIQEMVIQSFNEEKEVEDFFDGNFTPESNLNIEADGRRTLDIRYAGVHIRAMYDPEQTTGKLIMKGGIKHREDEKENQEAEDHLPINWIRHKLDDISIYYMK